LFSNQSINYQGFRDELDSFIFLFSMMRKETKESRRIEASARSKILKEFYSKVTAHLN